MSFQSCSSSVSSSDIFLRRWAARITFDFRFLVGSMKSMQASQSSHLCVGSILSWIGTDGQCLAAPHTHISALEPDQLTHPRLRDADWGEWVNAFTRKAPTHPELLMWYDNKITHQKEIYLNSYPLCGGDGVKVISKWWSGKDGSFWEKLVS